LRLGRPGEAEAVFFAKGSIKPLQARSLLGARVHGAGLVNALVYQGRVGAAADALLELGQTEGVWLSDQEGDPKIAARSVAAPKRLFGLSTSIPEIDLECLEPVRISEVLSYSETMAHAAHKEQTRKSSVLLFGTGQIGVFAARALKSRGALVHAADAAPDGPFYARFGPAGEAEEPAKLDVTCMRDVEAFVHSHSQSTAVVFAAGYTGDRATRDPTPAKLVAQRGLANVLGAARATGIQRAVVVSSLAVYGAHSKAATLLRTAQHIRALFMARFSSP